MQKSRPYFLDLTAIRLPIGGWVSILHRLTGAGLSLAVPILVYVWMLSLRSEADHATVRAWLDSGFGSLLKLAVLWGLLHHLFAGLRHLLLDLGWGKEKTCARKTAWTAMGAGVAAAVLLGVVL